jgi:hypothetical protein
MIDLFKTKGSSPPVYKVKVVSPTCPAALLHRPLRALLVATKRNSGHWVAWFSLRGQLISLANRRVSRLGQFDLDKLVAPLTCRGAR